MMLLFSAVALHPPGGWRTKPAPPRWCAAGAGCVKVTAPGCGLVGGWQTKPAPPSRSSDKKLRAELQWEFKRIHQRVGTTFIYVTHDQAEALSMSDQIAISRDGRIVQMGAPRALYERPATRFVADFLGKMNGRSARTHGRRWRTLPPGCRV